jgi:coenzyme F420-dependent glucose-6-phosphate dehydrogenase
MALAAPPPMTTRIGYALSSEEHGPQALVANAVRAERAGFAFATISDHFHPWIDAQGQSPFVWTVLGALAQATERLELGTTVTCPIIRTHPVIVAHAAATVAAMMPGRFFLGLGAGENLNEHVTGEWWPTSGQRLEMLEEAVTVIRECWKGELTSHRGEYYTVDQARLYTLPDTPPPIHLAASAEHAAELAGRAGDGLVSTSPDAEVVKQFDSAGGRGKPRYGGLTVCWAATDAEARATAHRIWPQTCLSGGLTWEVKTPNLFEAACKHVREEDVAKEVLCSADPAEHRARIEEYAAAGFDHVYVHQIGQDQEGFIAFYEREVLPKL